MCVVYVQEMCDIAHKCSPEVRQIDLDVNRTYRDHIMFRQRYDIKQTELFNVLGNALYIVNILFRDNVMLRGNVLGNVLLLDNVPGLCSAWW